jgi:hypothetical protein
MCLLLVFDANGKIPAGIISSVFDGCDLQKLTTGKPCGDQVWGHP